MCFCVRYSTIVTVQFASLNITASTLLTMIVGPEVHKQSMIPGEEFEEMNINNDSEGLPALSPAGDFGVLPPEMLFDHSEVELGLTPGSVANEMTAPNGPVPDGTNIVEVGTQDIT